MGNQRQAPRRQADRRAQPDRRQSTDRRRGADNRNVAFEICRSTVHLALVIEGSGSEPAKVITRSVPWRKEATTLYSEIGVQELTEAFRLLVVEERLAGARVRMALSGEFCVTRVVTGSIDSVRREFGELEERSHRYLTLGPGHKVLASSVQQLDARHEHALLTVANQRTLDAILAIADAVGIHISTIEPSLVALSRALACIDAGSDEACIVIQIDDHSAELGICHNGRLLLDYRPGGNSNAASVAGILAQHLARLQRYLDRYHSYLKTPVRQVYLTGDSTAVARAQQQFMQHKRFQVSVLEPRQLKRHWQMVSTAPGPEMAAALGTLLLDEQSDSEKRGPNLMERILAESRAPMRPILIRSLTPLAVVLLVAMGLFGLFQRERVATNAVRAELSVLEPVRTRARELQLTLIGTEAKLKQLRQLERKLARRNWGQLLTRIAQSMPDDVWLEGVVFHDAESVSLTGSSYADGGVYDFVGYLRQVPDITQIALEGTGVGRSPTGPTTSFDLQLSLAEGAARSD